jgi:hypothetical protein
VQVTETASKRTPAAIATGLLLVAGLVLAGCGSSSKVVSGAGASAAAIKSAASSGAASGSAAGASPSSTSSVVTGNPNSSFCVEAAAEQAQEDKDTEAFTTDSPADLKKFEDQAQAELKVFVSKAPAALKGDVQTIATADNALVAALDKVNYDFTKLDPTFATSFDTPAFEAAVTNVDNYLEQVCGIHPSDDSTS